MHIKTLLSLSIFLFFTNLANAACDVNGCNTNISRLYATNNENGIVYIKVADPIEPLNCTAPENSFLSLKSSHPLFKEIYSMLLAATLSNSSVRVRMVDNSPVCEVAYAWLNAQ